MLRDALREVNAIVERHGLQHQKIGEPSVANCSDILEMFRQRELSCMHAHDGFLAEVEQVRVTSLLMAA